MKKVFIAIVAVAMTFAQVAPALAQSVSNTGNGVDTNNTATVNQNNSTSVSQSNAASITNTISVISNTGDNTANRNTGGDVKVSTGDAGTKVAVENNANQNFATLNNCCATAGGVNVGNAGNGDSSYNNTAVNTNNSTALTQQNVADVTNLVTVDSNTGGNEADRNTGSYGFNNGVSVKSGDSLVGPITVKNNLNSNSAMVGPSNGAAGAGAGVTVGNVGNGVESDNNAVVNMNNTTALTQFNDAYVLNWVGVTSNTGANTANRNTGGDVVVDTGDSAIAVGLSTNANSNAAWVNNCGCIELGGTTVLNKGNGDSANSDAVVSKNNTSAALQANVSDIANVGYFLSDSGNNEADRNTGSVYGLSDPSIDTGVAYTNVGASTTANQNVLNSGVVAMPTLPPMGAGNSGYWSWAQWGYGYNM
jgi:hypothetical protein